MPQKNGHVPTLARNIEKTISVDIQQQIAKIAQLVEHDLAKVGVAGSSPVFRSKYLMSILPKGQRSLSRCKAIGKSRFSLTITQKHNEAIRFQESFLPGWWNGRHEGLKILWLHGCAGSSPASGTNNPLNHTIKRIFYFTKTLKIQTF